VRVDKPAGPLGVCVIDGVQDGLPLCIRHAWLAAPALRGPGDGGPPAQVRGLRVHDFLQIRLQGERLSWHESWHEMASTIAVWHCFCGRS
jgi:hypothetical protein